MKDILLLGRCSSLTSKLGNGGWAESKHYTFSIFFIIDNLANLFGLMLNKEQPEFTKYIRLYLSQETIIAPHTQGSLSGLTFFVQIPYFWKNNSLFISLNTSSNAVAIVLWVVFFSGFTFELKGSRKNYHYSQQLNNFKNCYLPSWQLTGVINYLHGRQGLI